MYVQTSARALGTLEARSLFSDATGLLWTVASSRTAVESVFESTRKMLEQPGSMPKPIPPPRLYPAPASAPAPVSVTVVVPASAPVPMPIPASAPAQPRIPPASLSMTPGAPPAPGKPEGAPHPGSVSKQDLERGQRQLCELSDNIRNKNMSHAVRTATTIASQSSSVMRNHLSDQLSQTLALLPAAGNQHIVKIRNLLSPMVSSSSSSSVGADTSKASAAAPTSVAVPATRADRTADPFRW